MNKMNDIIVRGNIFINSRLTKGTFSIMKRKFVDNVVNPDFEGTLLPAPINFHTHIGDSFIGEEPRGSLSEIVGPGGFKMRNLETADKMVIRKSMMKSINYMKKEGTFAFFDFRESGINGLKLIPKFKGINGIFMTRPTNPNEIEILLKNSEGFGMSSISDYDFKWLEMLSQRAKTAKKIFAIHFSENIRENVNLLLKLRPDFIVHSIEASEQDLDVIGRNSIPVAITPRSNIFFGKKPDYRNMLDHGLKMMLGTDNVFLTEPNIWQEAEFLYRYQRNIGYISPDDILTMITENPRKFAKSKGISFGSEKYILFENEMLSSYQIVTKPGFYRKKILYAH